MQAQIFAIGEALGIPEGRLQCIGNNAVLMKSDQFYYGLNDGYTGHPGACIKAKTEKAGDVTMDELAKFIIDQIPIVRNVPIDVVKPEQRGKKLEEVRVSKEEYENFIRSCPRPLEKHTTYICTPPVESYNDFTLGNWPNSVVASRPIYDDDPLGDFYKPEDEREYYVTKGAGHDGR